MNSPAVSNEKIIDEKKGNYLLRHWRGELSLPISYWLNGFLANIVAILFLLGIGGLLSFTNNAYAPLVYWLSAIFFILIVVCWQTVGIWRSSDRYIIEKGQHFWASAAKLMVVIGVFSNVAEINKTYVPAIKESLERIEWQSEANWDVLLLNGGKEIELSGAINTGIANELSIILDASKNVKTIHVNLSLGGLVDEAIILQKIISKNNLNTYVSGECVSACTIVFLGGKKRYIKSSAKLGFHAYKVPGLKENQMDYSDDKNYLKSLNVDKKFITKIFETPHLEMWYPEIDELMEANIVHEIVNGNEFSVSGLSSREVTSEIDGLASNLENMKNAATVEEIQKNVEEYNEKATSKFSLLKKKAISPVSIKFVELTEKQNNLSKKGELLMKDIHEFIPIFESMNYESNDEVELKNIEKTLVDFCELEKSYISLISDIVVILDEKIKLSETEEVKKEIFENQKGYDELIIKLRNNQAEILSGEEQAFNELSCNEII